MAITERRRWLREAALVAAVAVPTALDAWWNAPGTRQADAVTYLLLAVSLGALLGRRRAPVAVACGAALTGWYVLGHRGELLSLPAMVALYTVAASGGRRRTVTVCLVAVVWSGTVAGVTGGDRSPVAEMMWPVAALLLGEVVRGQRALRREYAARQARAGAEREREARRRVQAERLRIAREFHDVVAHTMAGVSVQMGVAVAAFDTRPPVAREALAQARAASGEALRELRATVALLRDPTDGTRARRPGRAGRADPPRRCRGLAAPPTQRAGPAGGGGAVRLPDRAGGSDQCGAPCPGEHGDRLGELRWWPDADGRRHGRRRVAGRPGTTRTRARVDRHHGTGRRSRRAGRVRAGARRWVPGPCHAAPGRRLRMAVRVVLADDQKIVRSGFRALLDLTGDLVVAGEAADGAEAVACVRRTRPDVVLMDIRMPGVNGLDATHRIVADPDLERVRVLVLTTFDLDEYVFEALRRRPYPGVLPRDGAAARDRRRPAR